MRVLPAAVFAALATAALPVSAADETSSCSAGAGAGAEASCSGDRPADVTTRLASLTCSGTLELFPDLPYGLEVDFSKQRDALAAAYGRVRERLRCHCPSLTDAQFHDRFSPARVVLNLIGGKPEHVEEIPCLDAQEHYTRDLHKYFNGMLHGSALKLPDTCTRASFVGAEGCRVELQTAGNLTANLRVAVSECEGSPVPSVGVWCHGSGCATLFEPCAEGGCGAGQECVVGAAGVRKFLGGAGDAALSWAQHYFGVNTTSVFDHLVRLVDGDIDSDRSIEDCEATFDGFYANVFAKVSSLLGFDARPGICIPEEWRGLKGLRRDHYTKWEHISGWPRKDGCAAFPQKGNSEYGWRRGQMTEVGQQSGGGWCIGFEDCNFHQGAGDCESNDDFEYYMGKLYCKYKQQDACRKYAPFCVWNARSTEQYKCQFNHSTQQDGLAKNEPKLAWMRDVKCVDLEDMEEQCDAAVKPIKMCEREYCACQGGKFDAEDLSCEPPPKKDRKGKCKDETQCWGALQQCYEKSGDKGPYMRTVRGCEKYFMCRCTKEAELWGCSPKLMCGKRCACMYSDQNKFVGQHCDLRLIRGQTSTITTYDEGDDAPEPPVLPWDGSLGAAAAAASTDAASFLRSHAVSHGVPQRNSDRGTEPLVATSCDGTVWLAPHSGLGLSLRLRGAAAFAEGVVRAALASFRCAIEGVSDDDEVALGQMAEAYLMHLPQMWTARFFAGATEGGGAEPFFAQGTLAHYIFNVSGESQVTDPLLMQLADEAEAELVRPGEEIEEGGWVPHLMSFASVAWENARYNVKYFLRAIGAVGHDTWYLAVHEQFSEQDERARNEHIRALIAERGNQVRDNQRNKTFPSFQWGGDVRVPEAYHAAVGRDRKKIGFTAALKKGALDVYLAQCERPGMSELQVGAGGVLAEHLNGRKACKKDSDCGEEESAVCHEFESTFFNLDIYDLDFMSGFLWGGNFTKGHITGCAELSTTINQKDFSTVKPKCIGKGLWKTDINAIFSSIFTGEKAKKGKAPKYCFTSATQVAQELTKKVDGEGGYIDLTRARALTSRPFTLPERETK